VAEAMSNDLLQRLMAAQTDEERSWIVTENLLESLPEDLATALWAMAIPHWFNAEILAALCPELTEQAENLYRRLQEFSFVEMFAERGHNVHELKRNQLLDRLWQENPERFRYLSSKAAEYFANTDKSESQIEWIYHLVIASPVTGIDELKKLGQRWDTTYNRSKLESLVIRLYSHITAMRTTIAVNAEVLYWQGNAKSRLYRLTEALESYDMALALYREIKNNLGEANTLRDIGTILQFLNRHNEAMDRYMMALTIYRNIHSYLGCLGEANTLISIGSVLYFHKLYKEALDRYYTGLDFYRKLGNEIGEANTLLAIGDVLKDINNFTQALERYEESLRIYRKIDSQLGEANALKAMGNALQSLGRYVEALNVFETTLVIYRKIDDPLGQANTLQSISKLQENPLIALECSQAALNIYTQIDHKLSQAQNLVEFTSEIQLKLGQKTEAISSLSRAAKLAEENNYSQIFRIANQKIEEIIRDNRPVKIEDN
jgi:tetratricopeptide (TPR) repeat protein